MCGRVGGGYNVKKAEKVTNGKIKKYPKTIKKLNEKDFIGIREDISMQLDNLSKFGKYYDDLVNEYLSLLAIREGLKDDIYEKGVRYVFQNGNGKEQEKANESVTNLIKVEQIMLKIINDLGINQPFIPPQPPKTEENTDTYDGDENDLL